MTQEVQEALARWLADYAGCGSPVEVMAIIRKDAMTLAEAFVEEYRLRKVDILKDVR